MIGKKFLKWAVYLVAFGVATWIYFDPMQLIKLATALVAWIGIVAMAFITNEIFHYIKEDIYKKED